MQVDRYKHLLTNAVLGKTEKLGYHSPSDAVHGLQDEDDDEDEDELGMPQHSAPAFPGTRTPRLMHVPAGAESPQDEVAFVPSTRNH